MYRLYDFNVLLRRRFDLTVIFMLFAITIGQAFEDKKIDTFDSINIVLFIVYGHLNYTFLNNRAKHIHSKTV